MKTFFSSILTFLLATSPLDPEVALWHLVVTILLSSASQHPVVSYSLLFSFFPRRLVPNEGNPGRNPYSFKDMIYSSFCSATKSNSMGPIFITNKITNHIITLRINGLQPFITGFTKFVFVTQSNKVSLLLHALCNHRPSALASTIQLPMAKHYMSNAPNLDLLFQYSCTRY